MGSVRASNAGCGILSKFFNQEIKELSRQINTSQNLIKSLPLNSKGERFHK